MPRREESLLESKEDARLTVEKPTKVELDATTRQLLDLGAMVADLEKLDPRNPDDQGDISMLKNNIEDGLVLIASVLRETELEDNSTDPTAISKLRHALNILTTLSKMNQLPHLAKAARATINTHMNALGSRLTSSVRVFVCDALNALLTSYFPGESDIAEYAIQVISEHLEDIKDGIENGSLAYYIPLLDTVARSQLYNSVRIKDDVLQIIADHLEAKTDAHSINSLAVCLWSGSEAVRRIGRDVFARLIKSFGVDDEKFLYAWMHSTRCTSEELSLAVERNIRTMANLEDRYPNAVKTLHRQFNIYDFGRYPVETLIRQYEQRDNVELPYGVLFYALGDDGSENGGAFYQSLSVIEKLGNDLAGLDYALRIAEGEDKIDLVKILRRLDRKYGRKHKISFGILGGHGAKDSVQLGTSPVDRFYLSSTDLGDIRAIRIGYFENHPVFILISCSTGIEDGIAQRLSELMDAEVIGPEMPTHIEEINAIHDRDRGLHFEVKYRDENTIQTYVSGEKLPSKPTLNT